jgi:hypothetical protein
MSLTQTHAPPPCRGAYSLGIFALAYIIQNEITEVGLPYIIFYTPPQILLGRSKQGQ